MKVPDRVDLKILRELQANARLSIAELAGRVSLTATPCARRVQQLENAGFIDQYATLLNQAAIGLPVNAFVEVRLTRERQEEIAEFETAVRSYREVIECWAMSGGYDYLLRVTSPDLESYNKFLRTKLLRLSCVDHVETNFALERVLYSTALPLDHLETTN